MEQLIVENLFRYEDEKGCEKESLLNENLIKYK